MYNKKEKKSNYPKIIKEYKDFINDKENELYEMANLHKLDTLLPVNIYISSNQNYKHGPRIKVQGDYSDKIHQNTFFVITVSDKPKEIGDIGSLKKSDVQLIKDWIILNKETLEDYWFGKERSLIKVLNRLKTLE